MEGWRDRKGRGSGEFWLSISVGSRLEIDGHFGEKVCVLTGAGKSSLNTDVPGSEK